MPEKSVVVLLDDTRRSQDGDVYYIFREKGRVNLRTGKDWSSILE